MTPFPPDIDIFCHVIDNFGDAGVVYRLAREYRLKAPAARIRVFTDEPAAFQAVCPQIDPSLPEQECETVRYIHYNQLTPTFVQELSIPPLIIEAFACEIPEAYLNKASVDGQLLINLDYLMAEEWVEGFHAKESLLGYPRLKKYFFMPGFTVKTGGLLPESQLDAIRPRLPMERLQLLTDLLKRFDLDHDLQNTLVGTVFSYEHNFSNLLEALHDLQKPVLLLIFGEKSRKSWQYLLRSDQPLLTRTSLQLKNVTLYFADFLPQADYDLLINLVDFNLVRGEDSLARSCRSGVPFIWHCYLEKERYHNVKIAAFNQMYGRYFSQPAAAEEIALLFAAYNERETDCYTEKTEENFTFFFNNLEFIARVNRHFADFLRNNCNLMEKLLSFVRSFPANNG